MNTKLLIFFCFSYHRPSSVHFKIYWELSLAHSSSVLYLHFILRIQRWVKPLWWPYMYRHVANYWDNFKMGKCPRDFGITSRQFPLAYVLLYSYHLSLWEYVNYNPGQMPIAVKLIFYHDIYHFSFPFFSGRFSRPHVKEG